MKKMLALSCLLAMALPVIADENNLSVLDYQVTNGTVLYGGLKQLFASDDERMVIGNDFGKPVVLELMSYVGPKIDFSKLLFEFEASVSDGNAVQLIEMYNYKLDRWVGLDRSLLWLKDQVRFIYLDRTYVSEEGFLNARVTWYPYGTPKAYNVDFARWLKNNVD
jgi:hypothetical protein